MMRMGKGGCTLSFGIMGAFLLPTIGADARIKDTVGDCVALDM